MKKQCCPTDPVTWNQIGMIISILTVVGLIYAIGHYVGWRAGFERMCIQSGGTEALPSIESCLYHTR